MNKKKKIVFRTRDFILILICFLSITAILITNNFEFNKNALADNEITKELKLLVEAQKNYKLHNNTFATSFEALDYQGLLEQECLAKAKKGYEFRLEHGGLNSFSFTANPQSPFVSNTYYYVDESGIIRYNINGPADEKSQPIDG